MRSSLRAPLISLALLAAACGPPPPSHSGGADATAASVPRELEVSVRMESELEEPAQLEDKRADDASLSSDEETKGDGHAAPPKLSIEAAPGGDSPPPPPPPPPPKGTADKKSKRKVEAPSPHAATAEPAGAKVDSATIQQVIAKNVASFKPCLRSDMALRLDATISPSGDVLEARSARSFPDDPKARDCVVLAVKRLRFERFDGAAAARVSFELTLKRALDY